MLKTKFSCFSFKPFSSYFLISGENNGFLVSRKSQKCSLVKEGASFLFLVVFFALPFLLVYHFLVLHIFYSIKLCSVFFFSYLCREYAGRWQ